MAQANALASLAEVKTLLGITSSSEDAKLELLIDAVSEQYEQFCQSYFVQRSVVEYREGGRKHIYLQRYPIVSVTSIVDPAGNTIPSTDYIIYKERGVLEHFGRFWVAQTTGGQPAQWAITYTAGRFADSSAVTPDLKMATAEGVSFMRTTIPNLGANSVTVGDLSITYANAHTASSESLATSQAITVRVAAALGPYKANIVP